MPLYTPFFERGMKNLGQAYGQRRTGEAAQKAYMGDREALGSLYRMSPETGMAVQQGVEQREQRQAQATQSAQEQRQEFINNILPDAANMPYEDAVQYAQEQADMAGIDISQNLQQYTPEAHQRVQQAVKEQPKLEPITVQRSGGRTQSAFVDSQGRVYNTQREQIELGPEDQIIEGSTVEGTPGDFGISGSEVRKVRQQETAARNVIDNVERSLSLLEESEDVNTFVAGADAIINDLTQEAGAIKRSFDDPASLNPSDYEDTLQDLGVNNRRLRGMFTSLAYQVARTRESGRLSDSDVRLAMQRFGANVSDPDALKQLLRDTARESVGNVKNSIRSLPEGQRRGLQDTLDSDLGLSRIAGTDQSGQDQGQEEQGEDPEIQSLLEKYLNNGNN